MVNSFISEIWHHTINFLTWRKAKPRHTTEAPRTSFQLTPVDVPEFLWVQIRFLFFINYRFYKFSEVEE